MTGTWLLLALATLIVPLGSRHAIRLAEEGADIIGLDICADLPHVPYAMATSDDLEETVAFVEKLDRRIVARVADVADRQAVQRVVDERVSVLVSRAWMRGWRPGGSARRCGICCTRAGCRVC